MRDPKSFIPRAASSEVLEALTSARVVAVIGSRQVGKSTLVRHLLAASYPARYLSLDDTATRELALSDPAGFVSDIRGPAVIDEIQRAPDLMLEIKLRVDNDNTPGQFLITGSANIQTLPRIADALPGRVRYVTLWPLSQAEIEGSTGNPVDALFQGPETWREGLQPSTVGATVTSRVLGGGYPSVYGASQRTRVRYFEDYLASVTGREIPGVATRTNASAVGRLLRLAAGRSATLLNTSSLARDLGIDHKTVDYYLRLLSDLMLIRINPPWHTGLAHREIKKPKIYVADTGMLLGLAGISEARFERDTTLRGEAFETFGVMELAKHAELSEPRARTYHYRDREGVEVDLVLEIPDGSVIGVEIKSSTRVTDADFRSLRRLHERAGSRFVGGVVLFSGEDLQFFGNGMWAVPFSCLWSR